MQNQAYPKLINQAGQTLTLPPPPPNEQMSATYIPQGDTYGEGVGIPGLGFSAEDSGTYSATSLSSWGTSQNTLDTALSTPLDDMGGRDRLYAAAMQNSRMASISSNAATSGIPPELAAQWTVDNVVLWLQANQFSKDWQETFKGLNIHGAQFLELGGRHAGRGNFGMMHQQVYPRLAKECSNSGTGWDPTREREEGKRMRRLIRTILTGRTVDVTRGPTHSRKESSNSSILQSAGADSIDSPNVSSPTYLPSYQAPGLNIQGLLLRLLL
jgi:mitogen-activated protein kinase kinase kinase